MRITKKKKERLICRFSGNGSFPIDMLRYDRCTPHTEVESGNITSEGFRTVEVLMSDEREPTLARWESFGWRLVDWRVVPF